MKKKPLGQSLSILLCLLFFCSTVQTFALSASVLPSGSVKITRPEAAASLTLQASGTDATLRLYLTAAGGASSAAGNDSDKNSDATTDILVGEPREGEPCQVSGSPGALYTLRFDCPEGERLQLRPDASGAGVQLSGDLSLAAEAEDGASTSAASRYITTEASGQITFSLQEGDARVSLRGVTASEGSAADAEADDRSPDADIVLQGEWAADEAPAAGSEQSYNEDILPEDARQDAVSTSMTLLSGALLQAQRVSSSGSASTGTVTYHHQYNDGRQNLASVFRVNIGGVSYNGLCADGKNSKTASVGTKVSLSALSHSSVLTRFAYLASRNYWNQSNYSTLDYQFALVNAARKLYGRPPAYERYASRALCARMMSDAKNYSGSIPSGFRAYMATPANQGQIMLVWGSLPDGKIKLKKISGGNFAILRECADAYTLAGAVYTVYNSAGQSVATLTTDSDGQSNTVSLSPGSYTVQETRAPSGYALDSTRYPVTISSSKTTEISAQDMPLFASIEIFLEKTSGGDSYLNPSRMSGAEFSIRYYDTVGDITGRKSLRTWRLQTTKDADGRYTAKLDAKHLLPGSDALFTTEDGEVVLPRGTVTIEETRAPKGYVRDKTVYTKRIDSNAESTTLYFNSGLPSSHVNQPATPSIGTKASDVSTGSALAGYGEQTILRDRVSYTGLYEGESYTLRGQLMDQATGEVIRQNGEAVTAETTFTVTEDNAEIAEGIASGEVSLDFTLDTTALAGKSTVVFETLYHNDKAIASHRDIDDAGQTLVHPKLATTAHSEASGDSLGVPRQDEVIVDTVEYSHLIPGKTYTVSGILMDKETGKAITDAEGKEITAEHSFTAESSEGTVELSFVYDSRLRQGTTTVVFETLYYDNIAVAMHADLEDEGQSIYYPGVPETPITGEQGLTLLYLGCFLTALTAAIALTLRRRCDRL